MEKKEFTPVEKAETWIKHEQERAPRRLHKFITELFNEAEEKKENVAESFVGLLRNIQLLVDANEDDFRIYGISAELPNPDRPDEAGPTIAFHLADKTVAIAAQPGIYFPIDTVEAGGIRQLFMGEDESAIITFRNGRNAKLYVFPSGRAYLGLQRER